MVYAKKCREKFVKNKMSPIFFSQSRFFPHGGAGKQTFAMFSDVAGFRKKSHPGPLWGGQKLSRCAECSSKNVVDNHFPSGNFFQKFSVN